MLLNMRFINKINRFNLNKIESECILYGKDHYVQYATELDPLMQRWVKIEITTDNDHDFIVILSEVDHDEYLICIEYSGTLYGLIDGHDITSKIFKMLTGDLDSRKDIEVTSYKSTSKTIPKHMLESFTSDDCNFVN